MTNPRRPDDPRLSTADLAAAGDRAAERQSDRQAAERQAAERQAAERQAAERQAERQIDQNAAQRAAQPVPPGTRQPTERDVTRAQQTQHTGVVADATANRSATSDTEHSTPLFAGNEADDFRHRWSDIQTGFVDEPRQAVERADALVASAIKRLAEIFANERATLEQQWARGGDVSTEDLRVALRRYRGFFDRLLSV